MHKILLAIAFFVATGSTQAPHIDFPGFRVTFPDTGCEIQKKEKEVDVPVLGKTAATSWIMYRQEAATPFLYLVSFTRFPEMLANYLDMDPKSLNTLLRTCLEASASNFGGTDFTFKEFSHNGYEGLEATCKISNGGGDLKGRVFKSGSLIYVICGGGAPIDLAETDKFLASFRLEDSKTVR
ncbi:MAG: hypothetical protein LBR65_00065 [Culturomica sp.]|jgi:hypothetical protein|nr:hypothetical protein [Culturomica sp.]